MLFHINTASGVPVYRQIIDQVKRAMASGALRPGDRLPPVRKLAEDHGINPNTVARAYQEMLGGVRGTKHCVLPEAVELIVDRGDDGRHLFRVMPGQTAADVMHNLGYAVPKNAVE